MNIDINNTTDSELKKLLGLLIFGGNNNNNIDDNVSDNIDDNVSDNVDENVSVDNVDENVSDVASVDDNVTVDASIVDDVDDNVSDVASVDENADDNASDVASDDTSINVDEEIQNLEKMDKERKERIERYDNIFNNLKQTIINEQKNKEPIEVNDVIKLNLFGKKIFGNMIQFYNDYQPEIVLKILYIFELYKNIIKINNEKKELLLNKNLDKDTKDELYKNLLIDRKKYIDELIKFENFEQAKPHLEVAINDINLDFYSDPDKEYNDENLYNLLKESENAAQSNNLPRPPSPSASLPSSLSPSSSLSSLSRTQSSNQAETFTPPPPPSVEQKEVLIIKPLTNTVRDANNKVIDFHEGPANDKMTDTFFGENPNYTEFFEFDKSIDSEEFIDATEGNKYDYIWIASPLIIDTTFKPIPICVDNLKKLLKKDGRVIFTLPTKNKNNNTIKIQDLYRDYPKPIDDVRKKDIEDLTTVFNQNFDYVKNDGYRMYKLKDIIEPPSNVISDESIIEGIIGEILAGTSTPSIPRTMLSAPKIPGIPKIPKISGMSGMSRMSGMPGMSRMPQASTNVISDQSIIEGIIGEVLDGMSRPSISPAPRITGMPGIPSGPKMPLTTINSDESIINGIIGEILAGTSRPPIPPAPQVPIMPATNMTSDESIINGIIGEILAGTSRPPIPPSPPAPQVPIMSPTNMTSDESIINGIIGEILAGTSKPSSPFLSRLSSLLPSMPSLTQLSALISSIINRILKNVLRGIKFTGKGVVGLTLLSGAIALGALYALGYIAPKELYKYINKLLNNTKIPDEITEVIKLIKLSIGANAESIEKLKNYTKIGTAGIIAGPPLLALGLAAGSLYGLGYITKKTLSTIVSNNKLRPSQGESDEDIEDDIKLSDQIINDVEELVELDKKHHIIDKILNEPITKEQERPNMSPLVARIEQIEEVGDNINHNIIKEIFLEQEPVKNGPDNTMI